MIISDVHRSIEKHKKRRRVGRGIGSGNGKTAARGHKGQFSRAGSSRQVIFEGGHMPVIRRIPKRGFHNAFAFSMAVVNVGDLEARFSSGDEVTPDALKKNGLAKHPHDQVKILGTGDLKKKLNVSAHAFSKSAQEKIQSAGGSITVLPGPKPVHDVPEKKRPAATEQSAEKKPARKKAEKPAAEASSEASSGAAKGEKKEKTPRQEKKKPDAGE
jgi:large subunit ribosomal protein L15